jgi:hypothetical protein
MWKRVERLRTLAEMPATTLMAALDVSHASPYLSETIATCRTMPKAQRHALRHQPEGGEVVQEALRTLATTRRNKAITRAFGSLEAHAPRMRYRSSENELENEGWLG